MAGVGKGEELESKHRWQQRLSEEYERPFKDDYVSVCLINPIRKLLWGMDTCFTTSVPPWTLRVAGSLSHLAQVITRLSYLGRLVYFSGRCPRGFSMPDPSLPLSVPPLSVAETPGTEGRLGEKKDRRHGDLLA